MEKFKMYDAFETKQQAESSAKDLKAQGSNAVVRKIKPQDNGRLKWGLFTDDKQLV